MLLCTANVIFVAWVGDSRAVLGMQVNLISAQMPLVDPPSIHMLRIVFARISCCFHAGGGWRMEGIVADV